MGGGGAETESWHSEWGGGRGHRRHRGELHTTEMHTLTLVLRPYSLDIWESAYRGKGRNWRISILKFLFRLYPNFPQTSFSHYMACPLIACFSSEKHLCLPPMTALPGLKKFLQRQKLVCWWAFGSQGSSILLLVKKSTYECEVRDREDVLFTNRQDWQIWLGFQGRKGHCRCRLKQEFRSTLDFWQIIGYFSVLRTLFMEKHGKICMHWRYVLFFWCPYIHFNFSLMWFFKRMCPISVCDRVMWHIFYFNYICDTMVFKTQLI